MPMTAAEVLKRPYGRTVMPEPDGTFRAEIIEFPGCIAVGDNAVEALERLEDVVTSWLEVALSKEQVIPAPIENAEGFSGKLVLRLPKSLHKKAAHMAAREGVSLNQFLLSSLSEQIGGRVAAANIRQRFAAMFYGSSLSIGTGGQQISHGTSFTGLPLPAAATGSWLGSLVTLGVLPNA